MIFKEERIPEEDNYKWYIIQTYNALSARISLSQDDKKKAIKIEEMFRKENFDHLVKEVFVPIEEKKNLYTSEVNYNSLAPGYIFICMNLTEDGKRILRDYQTTIGFLTGGYKNPNVVSSQEIQTMKEKVQERNSKQLESFSLGDVVRINHAEFMDFQGIITDFLENNQVHVSISIFGRNTSIKFSIQDLEKIDSSEC